MTTRLAGHNDAKPSSTGESWPWLQSLDDVCLLRGPDLRQVIRSHRRLLGFDVPHAESYLIGRTELVRIVEHEGLYIDLPDHVDPVLLVAGPSANDRAVLPDWVIERRLLAAVLHVRAEAALANARERGNLSAARVRELLGRLDDAAVREVTRVLQSLEQLDEEPTAVEVLTETVATALTLLHTTDGHLALWFPTLDPTELEAVLDALAIDLTPDALLGEQGATRAAVLSRRATVPSEAVRSFEAVGSEASDDRQLALRLATALAHLELPGLNWAAAMGCLRLPTVRRRQVRARRRLRRELGAAARALEQPGLRFRPLRYLGSLGRAELFDRLEEQPHVRLQRCLIRARRYARQLTPASHDLLAALGRALDAQRHYLVERLTPVLTDTLTRSGLVPTNVPEEVAAQGIVSELLDRLLEAHYLGFGDLRDGISRSQLKLRDTTLASFVLGDALLRADRGLARRLPGVYRKSAVYMRVIQRASALAFGTRAGRLLTRFVLLPFLTAFVALEGGQHLIGPLIGLVGLGHPRFVHPVSVGAVGAFLLLMFEHRPSRQRVWSAVVAIGRGLRWAFVDLPEKVVSLETLRRLADSYLFALVRRFVLRPLLVLGSLWLLLRAYELSQFIPELGWLGALVGASAALNSRFGRRVQTDVSDTLGGWWGQLTKRLLPELLRGIVRTSKRVMDALEKAVHRVEEALRLRRRQSLPAQIARAVAGRLWAAVSYLVQLYVTLLIEPQINPVKHFPVVTVSHKVMLPALPQITQAIEGVAIPLLGQVGGRAFAWANVFLLPGFFGFVVWELSSNWRLFEANRPGRLKPVAIGAHGERLPSLLRPGFRSGAVPKHVERMRREATEAWQRGGRPDLRDERRELTKLEERVHAFFSRELAKLLAQAGALERRPAVQAVQLGRYRLGILLAPSDATPLGLWLEDRDDRLVATLRREGFAGELDARSLAALADALMGVFQLAEVDVLELPATHSAAETRLVEIGHRRIAWDDWVKRWSGPELVSPAFDGAVELAAALAERDVTG